MAHWDYPRKGKVGFTNLWPTPMELSVVMCISTFMFSHCWLLSSCSGFFFEENRSVFWPSFDGDAFTVAVGVAWMMLLFSFEIPDKSVLGNLDESLMPRWRERLSAFSRIFCEWDGSYRTIRRIAKKMHIMLASLVSTAISQSLDFLVNPQLFHQIFIAPL